MGETGIILSFPGNLDPRAEEFRPNTINIQCQWYPLPPPLPLPLPIPLPPPNLTTSSTRSLLLTPVPLTSHSALRAELQAFGDIRALQTEALRHGILTVHFFDLRHAQSAFAAIRSMQLHFHPNPGLLSAHYVLPNSNSLPDSHNQGTLVIFNLHPNLSSDQLRRLFQPFGPIKELRDTPWKKNQRFVEFFDIRDAAKALKHMNGKEIDGKQVVIEFSRPGGHTRKFFHHHSKTTVPPLNFNAPRLHSSQKKSPGSPSNSTGSIDAEMGSMSLTGGEVEEQHSSSQGPTRRNLGRKHTTLVVGNTKQQQVPRSRHWKGKQAKKHETRFLIKEDAIVESGPKDTRTTVMIKNIPNKYRHCNEQIADGEEQQPLSSYDFQQVQRGIWVCEHDIPGGNTQALQGLPSSTLGGFQFKKICEVTYARVQGLEALKEHFKNSKFPCEMEHYLPVVFSPPRDGKELTEPLPLVGNKQQQQQQAIPIPISSGGDGDVASSKSGGVGGDDETNEEEVA
ncbi:Protein terminal ear1 [Glycine max]|nr:Protein terminal ear1 [Glycine max]